MLLGTVFTFLTDLGTWRSRSRCQPDWSLAMVSVGIGVRRQLPGFSGSFVLKQRIEQERTHTTEPDVFIKEQYACKDRELRQRNALGVQWWSIKDPHKRVICIVRAFSQAVTCQSWGGGSWGARSPSCQQISLVAFCIKTFRSLPLPYSPAAVKGFF